ncbi:MAG: D-alanine--D-alanine ligase [Sporichthyaceae bacterium]|nr:D-alanine--D-alanine ligase [Sporichthyaceae bacterium]
MTETPRGGRPRIAVVFGGRSTEHAVSCVSAGSVLAAIDRGRYDVIPIGISREGRWVLAADEPDRLVITGERLPEVEGVGATVVLTGDPTHRSLVVQEPGQVPREMGDVDVVLPLLHGPFGEDGTIQGLLELAGVPYVGSGVFASAAAMDKGHMKALLQAAGLPVGPYAVVTPRQWDSDPAAVRETASVLGYPLFVKPARGGSSVGITKVSGPDELDAAVEAARGHDPRVVLEAAVQGREIECGVLEGIDGATPDASLPGEVVVGGGHEFYDFAAKYLPGEGTDLLVPADLPAEVVASVQQLAIQAFEALSCEGLARVDFFVGPDRSVLVNEVNTMPGFTPVSMFPLMWHASGLDYPALVDRLVETALARRPGLR